MNIDNNILELDIDNSHELKFKVKIESSSPQTKKVTTRLVCESDSTPIVYSFNGQHIGDDTVQFNIPEMSRLISEGVVKAKVEVVVENKFFTPVSFDINFQKTDSVIAESLELSKVNDDLKVNVSPMLQESKIIKPKKNTLKEDNTLNDVVRKNTNNDFSKRLKSFINE